MSLLLAALNSSIITAFSDESYTLIDTSSVAVATSASDIETTSSIDVSNCVAAYIASVTDYNRRNRLRNTLFLGPVGGTPDGYTVSAGSAVILPQEVIAGHVCYPVRVTCTLNGGGSNIYAPSDYLAGGIGGSPFSIYIRRPAGASINSVIALHDTTLANLGQFYSVAAYNAIPADTWIRRELSSSKYANVGIGQVNTGSIAGNYFDIALLQGEAYEGSTLASIYQPTDNVSPYHPVQSAQGYYNPAQTDIVESTTSTDTEDGLVSDLNASALETSTLTEIQSVTNLAVSDQVDTTLLIDTISVIGNFVSVNIEVSTLIESSSVTTSFVSTTIESNVLAETTTAAIINAVIELEPSVLTSAQDIILTQFADEIESTVLVDVIDGVSSLLSANTELNNIISNQSAVLTQTDTLSDNNNVADTVNAVLSLNDSVIEVNSSISIQDSGFYISATAQDISNAIDYSVLYRLPLNRAYLIKPEDRLIVITQEDRTFDVNSEIRSLSTNLENRSILIPDEDRNIVINEENREILL